MAHPPSTRTQSRSSGGFVRSTPGSHSLERGLELLRAFRLGVGVLGNAELAARTGLPRPTVSRLTRSLVDADFLVYDHGEQGYRLTPAFLSLALAYRSAETPLDAALPLMRALAEGRRVNVGMAMADQLEMVYLDSVRLSRIGLFRRIVPGSRIPIAETALGCAFLAGLAAPARTALLARLRQAHGEAWPPLLKGVEERLQSVHVHGYCCAFWHAGLASVAVPLRTTTGRLYALNVSFPVPTALASKVIEEHAALVLQLAIDIAARWAIAVP